MMSNGVTASRIYRTASARSRRMLLSPSSRATFSIKRPCMGDFSTEVTEAASRERNSKDTAPVPAKRSRQRAPSMSVIFSMTLKMFSRAKSVVGRAVIFVGTSKRRRPYFPRIIRITGSLLSQKEHAWHLCLRGTSVAGISKA